jgi:hypothetical protein
MCRELVVSVSADERCEPIDIQFVTAIHASTSAGKETNPENDPYENDFQIWNLDSRLLVLDHVVLSPTPRAPTSKLLTTWLQPCYLLHCDLTV